MQCRGCGVCCHFIALSTRLDTDWRASEVMAYFKDRGCFIFRDRVYIWSPCPHLKTEGGIYRCSIQSTKNELCKAGPCERGEPHYPAMLEQFRTNRRVRGV